MKTFKTKTGIEIPIMDMRGKDYVQVAWRLVWWRAEHPDHSIETEYLTITDMVAVAKATIRDEKGRVLATSHKTETRKDFPAGHAEKAETGAIGRALALCGYGTQFAPDLDEEDRIVDSPIQPKKPSVASKPLPNRNNLNKEITAIYQPFMKVRPHCIFKSLLMERYGVEEIKLMTLEQIQDLLDYMKAQIESVK